MDERAERLGDLDTDYDLLTKVGSPTSIRDLKEIGVKDCDLFIAVTPHESENMTACLMANQLGAKKTLARIDNYEYLLPENKRFFENMGLNHLIYPEVLAANEIVESLKTNWLRYHISLCDGALELCVLKVRENAEALGKAFSSGFFAHGRYRVVAIKRENDTDKLAQLGKEIADLSEQRNQMKARWQSEKSIVENIQTEVKNIESYKFEAEQAERAGDYGKVAELRYGRIKEAEKHVADLKQQLKEMQADNAMINEEVDSEQIAEVVSKWTGIPVTRMLQSERERLLHLEDELHKRVVGQDEAISTIANAIRRSRTGLSDGRRPIGSFLFLGTTGVGKTELARALAEVMFDDEDMMVRIDMSEYQERHSVSRLIGAPPGYVGYDESGQLTEAVRRKPYSIVLFDEIEKAHPDVFNTLLQVLEDGRLTDNKGRTADFKNTVIIMTSNMGSDVIRERLEGSAMSEYDLEETKKAVLELLKQQVRPEFINRIDEIVMFRPLTKNQIREVVKIQLANAAKMLEKNEILISATDEAIDHLATIGYDPAMGARPVKRVIQREILNELSRQILEEKIKTNDTIIIDVIDDQFVFYNPQKRG